MDDNAIKGIGKEQVMSALYSWRVRINPSALCHSTLSSISAASKVHILPDALQKMTKNPRSNIECVEKILLDFLQLLLRRLLRRIDIRRCDDLMRILLR